jgi:hypothetical protein
MGRRACQPRDRREAHTVTAQLAMVKSETGHATVDCTPERAVAPGVRGGQRFDRLL